MTQATIPWTAERSVTSRQTKVRIISHIFLRLIFFIYKEQIKEFVTFICHCQMSSFYGRPNYCSRTIRDEPLTRSGKAGQSQRAFYWKEISSVCYSSFSDRIKASLTANKDNIFEWYLAVYCVDLWLTSRHF